MTTNQEARQAYYCSREWGLKKEAVHKRSSGTCERCRKNKGQAVHHKTYIRLYNERLEDLIHLCNGCHDFEHGKSDVDPKIQTIYLAHSIPVNFEDLKIGDKTQQCPCCGNRYLCNNRFDTKGNKLRVIYHCEFCDEKGFLINEETKS